MSTVSDKVALGVALLDDDRPDWGLYVNTEKLDILSPDRCVLGQVYGTFDKGMKALDIALMEPFGFCPYSEDVAETEAEWRRVILERVRNAE